MRISIIAIFISCFPLIASAQNSLSYKETLTSNVNELRQDLIDESDPQFIEFNKGIERLYEEGLDTMMVWHLVQNIQTGSSVYKLQYRLLKKEIKKYYKDLGYEKLIDKSFVKSVKANSLLVNFINADFLEPMYPYKINHGMFEELAFYNLKEGQQIADIGAGLGTLSFLLTAADLDLGIHVNEIDKDLIKYIKSKKRKHFAHYDDFKVIKGKKKDVKLNSKMDKVILRATLHHLSHTEQMLSSIKEILKSDGILYIVEIPAKENPHLTDCPHAMHRDEIISTLNENGFTLENVMEAQELLFQQYKISQQ